MTEVMSDFRQMIKKKKKEEEKDLKFAPIDRHTLRVAPVKTRSCTRKCLKHNLSFRAFLTQSGISKD